MDFNDIDIIKAMKRAGHRVQWRRKKGDREDGITWSIGTDYKMLVKNSKKEGLAMHKSKKFELAERVLEYACLEHEYKSCDTDIVRCSMCQWEEPDIDGVERTLENFPHNDDCPYVLAVEIVKKRSSKA